jgi:hypothetical protein
MHNVSANGSSIRLVASYTFPAGFDLTKFADDTNPFEFTDNSIASHGSGINGDLVVWSTASGIEMTLSALPDTDECRNLEILWAANKVAPQKVAVKDIITLIVSLPNGKQEIYSGGAIISGPAGTSASSDGRLASKQFGFVFERKVM